jgi:uncharacterized protein YqeY
MTIRDRLEQALKQAMKSRDAFRLSALRLVNAAIKDRDIALRGEGAGDAGVGDAEILSILVKMVKQRQESARLYEEGGRLELAEKELGEIRVIEEFLPRQLSQEESVAAIDAIITQLGASSIRDMGRVMAALKAQYAGQMDFAAAGAAIKARLG